MPTVDQNTNSAGAVRAGQDALYDLDQEDCQQHVGRIVVHRPQQPPAGHLGLKEVDAFPRRLLAGAIVDPKEEAGNGLHTKEEQNGARPHLAPTRPAGNRRVGQAAAPIAQARAIIEPMEEILHPQASKWGRLSVMLCWLRAYCTKSSGRSSRRAAQGDSPLFAAKTSVLGMTSFLPRKAGQSPSSLLATHHDPSRRSPV